METRTIFQSTHLVWGATKLQWVMQQRCINFNPRTSCEVRRRISRVQLALLLFQSTHLVWGATPNCVRFVRNIHIFQYTHLVWGATTCYRFCIPHPVFISIHAPRVRCDTGKRSCYQRGHHFNPRTSCEVRQQKYRSFLFIFAIYDIIKNFNRIIFILFHLITSTI